MGKLQRPRNELVIPMRVYTRAWLRNRRRNSRKDTYDGV